MRNHLKKIGFLFITLMLQASVFANVKLHKICDLPDKLKETSGLELVFNKYLITHNDSGNETEIHVLTKDGEYIKEIEIDKAKNKDWEDLTTDDAGRLYIADIGNNDNKRENCKIYILKSDFLIDENNRINADEIEFTYEDQKEYPPDDENLNYDAEGLIWMKGKLYIFTKCRSKPFTGKCNVYILPDEEGEYEAKKIGTINLCSLGWQFCSVTAADYNPEKNELVLLTYSRMYTISDFPGNRFWEGKIESHSLLGLKQREGITYAGKDTWYMTDEHKKGFGGGNLYKVTRK